jgi:outer membrane usher protein
MLPGLSLPASTSNLFIGLPLGCGSLSAGYTRQINRGEPNTEFATLSYQVRVSKGINLLANYFQSLAGTKSKTLILTLNIPFGARGNASVQNKTSLEDGSSANYVTLQQSAPAGEGYGWDLQLSDRRDNAAAGTYRGRYGVYSAQVNQLGDNTTSYLSASGGVGVASGMPFASRRIDGSFGVVEVPGFANVRVYQDNQLMGKTDAQGRLLLPQLRPYEINPVRIDYRDLPLNTSVATFGQNAIPAYRSGSLLLFPVHTVHPVLVTLVTEDGKPLPTDAHVMRVGGGGPYAVGKDGLVYVDDIQDGSILSASFDGTSCEVRISLPASKDPLQDLGKRVCTGRLQP